MAGSKGRTDAIVLDKRLYNDFERGAIDDYKITAMDAGDVYVIHLQNDKKGAASDWFVNKITILKESCDFSYEFPCYSWVSKKFVAFHGAGITTKQLYIVTTM